MPDKLNIGPDRKTGEQFPRPVAAPVIDHEDVVMKLLNLVQYRADVFVLVVDGDGDEQLH
jgi:hypothetical protein